MLCQDHCCESFRPRDRRKPGPRHRTHEHSRRPYTTTVPAEWARRRVSGLHLVGVFVGDWQHDFALDIGRLQ